MTKKNNKHFGEIIESSLDHFKAQTWKWDNFPKFGSLIEVQTDSRTLYGIVCQIQTGSLDSHRIPFAYQKTEEELKKEQPQIFEYLQTIFTCICVGFKENNKIHYQIAPEPPKIHTFVQTADRESYRQFFDIEHYLQIIFGNSLQISNIDELLLAIIKTMSENEIINEEKILKFTQSYSLHTANDYRRLKLFLERLSHNL
ncbi:hypothetical protein M1446_04470 [Candidatus Dependentiae bacterium]|nr:hypothetical protein [Candidatus Dependentiae bacterium]